MQRTRLNDLVLDVGDNIYRQLQKRWYVHCLRLISLFGGFFSASAVSTWAGQRALWDILLSLVLMAFIELVNWCVYRQTWITEKTSLNLFKIGLLGGLAVEGFKLAS